MRSRARLGLKTGTGPWPRLAALAFAVVAALLAASHGASAEKRVAFVVGNAAYVNAGRLANPVNDATDVAAALREVGFEVILGLDLDKRGFDDKVREYATALAGADVGLFFYAGHGLQAKGLNYLVPVDARLTAERDLDFETVKLDFVMAQLEREAKTSIVMLDACRNNPLARGLAASMATRGVGESQGLALTRAEGLGMFIAYATQPGNVALDGADRNSPFTASLKKEIPVAGLSLSDLMIEVRNDVVAATNGAQRPWDHSALTGRFYFKPAPEGENVVASEGAMLLSEAAQVWSSVKDTTNQAILRTFIAQYESTIFGKFAQARLEEITSQIATAATARGPDHAPADAEPETSAPLAAADLVATPPSFDCKVHFAEAEVAICNTPELARLDNDIARIYGAAASKSDSAGKQALKAEQLAWLKARNACGGEVACLTEQHVVRKARLVALAPSAGPERVGTAAPSFDCKTVVPAEVAICNSEELATADKDVDRAYFDVWGRLDASRKKALLAEQRQWLAARNTCGADAKCIAVQYEARQRQLANWR